MTSWRAAVGLMSGIGTLGSAMADSTAAPNISAAMKR